MSTRWRHSILLLALIPCAMPFATAQAQVNCETALAEADDLYYRQRPDSTLLLLEPCIDTFDEVYQIAAYRLMAFSYFVLDDDESSASAVAALLKIDPNYRADPKADPPFFQDLISTLRSREPQTPVGGGDGYTYDCGDALIVAERSFRRGRLSSITGLLEPCLTASTAQDSLPQRTLRPESMLQGEDRQKAYRFMTISYYALGDLDTAEDWALALGKTGYDIDPLRDPQFIQKIVRGVQKPWYRKKRYLVPLGIVVGGVTGVVVYLATRPEPPLPASSIPFPPSQN